MSQPGDPSRGRHVLLLAVPMVVGAALSTVLVLNQHERVRLAAAGRVGAWGAGGGGPPADAIRPQRGRAPAAAPEGASSIPAAGGPESGASPASLIEARDTGVSTLDDQAGNASIVVPVYRAGLPTRTTAERRQAIDAYRITPLSLLPLITELAPDGGGANLRGPSGAVVERSRRVPHGARSFGVDLNLANQPGWRLEAWVPDPGPPNRALLGTLVILGLSAIVAVTLGALSRQRLAERERNRQLQRHRALVSGLAPVVQTSLDLAHVVPAVSTQLTEGLALDGLGLSVAHESGERLLFSWGQAPDMAVLPAFPAPHHLETGETFALGLTRGGRVLGVLRIVAGEPLGQDDMQALSTAGELLGSTLANAEAFARQQVLVERMRSVDELKTIFLATASHELRTPVTAIVGFSALLLKQWETIESATGRQFLERVHANGQRLDALIEQLLDFSRLESGLHTPGTEVLDLGESVRRILEEQLPLSAGHELRCDLAAGCTVRGSTSAIERIVTNLVGNAAKYSPPGTAITVTVRAEGDRSLLVVDDEGPGVPDSDRERVFSRFFRGSGDTVASTRGAGIGLAIVAEYAASMSGTAAAQRAPSGGARFVVSFPVAHAINIEGARHVPIP